MKITLFILAIFYALNTPVYGQSILYRDKDKTIESFISAFTDTLSLAHKVVKIPTQDRVGIIYLIPVFDTLKSVGETNYRFNDNRIVLFSLITYDMSKFNLLVVDTISFDNNPNEELDIKAIFFANCNQSKDKEMLITFSAFYNRHAMAGYVYKTFAYNFPKYNNLVWVKEQKISTLFNDYDIGEVTDGKSKIKESGNKHLVKYDLAANVKKKLKEMGY